MMREKFEVIVILEGTVESTGQSSMTPMKCVLFLTLTFILQFRRGLHICRLRYYGVIGSNNWFPTEENLENIGSITAASTILTKWTLLCAAPKITMSTRDLLSRRASWAGISVSLTLCRGRAAMMSARTSRTSVRSAASTRLWPQSWLINKSPKIQFNAKQCLIFTQS